MNRTHALHAVHVLIRVTRASDNRSRAILGVTSWSRL